MNKEDIIKELDEMKLLNPMNSFNFKMRDLQAIKMHREFMKNNNSKINKK